MVVVSLDYYVPSPSSHIPSVDYVTHMSAVSFVILGEKREWEGYKFPLDSTHWGQPQQPSAHLETVQPVAHMGKALLGGDVVHEHHSISLAEQLPRHAVVPAQRVRIRPCQAA